MNGNCQCYMLDLGGHQGAYSKHLSRNIKNRTGKNRKKETAEHVELVVWYGTTVNK